MQGLPGRQRFLLAVVLPATVAVVLAPASGFPPHLAMGTLCVMGLGDPHAAWPTPPADGSAAGVLSVRSILHRCEVPIADVGLDQARVFDREEHPQLRPRITRNGVGMPGFQSGHFRLRNGHTLQAEARAGRP